MAITYPRSDIMDLLPVADVQFWPLHRQELSRTAGGKTQAKDMGPPLWRLSATSAAQGIQDAAALEAALISLRGSQGSFLAHDPRRPYPAAHPGGYNGDLSISALYAGDAFAVKVAAVSGGLELRPGDYLGFEYGARPSRSLHMVMEPQTIVTAGAAKKITVWPAIPPGATVGAAVTVNRASCEMILEPDQSPPGLRAMRASVVSFSAIQIF